MKTNNRLKLRSLERFAQQSRYGISHDMLSALLMASSTLRNEFANMTPYLDLALTKPAAALWVLLSGMSHDNVVDDGLEIELARKFQRQLDAVGASIERLTPVLCPKLAARLADAYSQLRHSSAHLVAWLGIYKDAHNEAVAQVVPTLPIQWSARLAASPTYFTAKADELGAFSTVLVALPDGRWAQLNTMPHQPLCSIGDLLSLLAAARENTYDLRSVRDIYRLEVDEQQPHCLRVLAR